MKKKLLWRVVFILLVALTIAGLAVVLNAESRAESFLISKIEEQLGEDFHFEFEESTWGFFNRSVAVKNIEFSRSQGDSILWESTVDKIEFFGFGVYEYLVGKVYRVDSLILSRPVINLFDLKARIDSTNNPHQGILKKAAIDVGVQKIQIKNGQFTYNPSGPEYLSAKYESMVEDVQIDGTGAPIKDYIKNAHLIIRDLVYVTPDSFSTINVSEMGTLIDQSTLFVSELSLKSNYSISEYTVLHNWRKAMFELDLESVQIDMSRMIKWTELTIPKVNVSGLHLSVNQNLRYPLPERVTLLPQSMAMETELLFQIDSIFVKNSQVDYFAHLKNYQVSETNLTEINATIAPFQNRSMELPLFTLQSTSTLYGAAPLAFQTTYMFGENDPFEFSGSLGRTKMEFLDNFLFNAAGVEISNGALDRLEFSVNGTKYGTTGYTDFYYQNLEIKALNQETGKYKVGLNALSNVLGGLVFWKSNPAHDQYRRGDFQMNRDGRKGFVAQWVDSILEGIITTVSKVNPVIVRGNKKKKK